MLFNACSFVARGPEPQEGGGLGQARDFAKNSAFSSLDSDFAKNRRGGGITSNGRNIPGTF